MSTAKAPELRKVFTGTTPGGARALASAWLGDFKTHGPLHIRSIRVVEEEVGGFTAVITYREAVIETSPRYFTDQEPLKKSA
jgi:hypothetical protein